MPRRAATVTQADIARVIRAVRDAGLPVVRVVVRADGVAVETSAEPRQDEAPEAIETVAREGRVVVL